MVKNYTLDHQYYFQYFFMHCTLHRRSKGRHAFICPKSLWHLLHHLAHRQTFQSSNQSSHNHKTLVCDNWQLNIQSINYYFSHKNLFYLNISEMLERKRKMWQEKKQVMGMLVHLWFFYIQKGKNEFTWGSPNICFHHLWIQVILRG
jgi:hypothetical protein